MAEYFSILLYILYLPSDMCFINKNKSYEMIRVFNAFIAMCPLLKVDSFWKKRYDNIYTCIIIFMLK